MKGYRRFLSKESAQAIVDNIMRRVDTDNNGSIDYNEFLKAGIDVKKVATADYLKSAFALFDKDGNGKISLEELKSVLQAGGEDDIIWQEIIKRVDIDGDGEIDINEFTAIIQKVQMEQ